VSERVWYFSGVRGVGVGFDGGEGGVVLKGRGEL